MQRRAFIRNAFAVGTAPFLFGGCAAKFASNRKINIGVVGYGRIAHTYDLRYSLAAAGLDYNKMIKPLA